MNFKLAIAQTRSVVGALSDNYNKILDFWREAEKSKVDIVVFPELTVCGYNIQDLAFSEDFLLECEEFLQLLLEQSCNFNSAAVVGNVRINKHYFNKKRSGDNPAYNTAYFIHKGKILSIYDKVKLPNYGVFDEKRVFQAEKNLGQNIKFKGLNITILICEDAWYAENYCSFKHNKIDLILVINASPYSVSKYNKRLSVLSSKIASVQAQLVYVNQVGLQDDLIFDGRSMVFNSSGKLVYQSPAFEENLDIIVLDKNSKAFEISKLAPEEEIYSALVRAIKDYLLDCSFNEVVIGLSGGIDSTLTAMICVDALGKDKVHLVSIPSRYTSKSTYQDTQAFLERISKQNLQIDLEPIFSSYLGVLHLNTDLKNNLQEKIAVENLQARIRGSLLMAVSNRYNYLLVATSNKSELSVGYTTLYGDMNGGYNLLKDLYKTDVYKLARWRNLKAPKNAIKKSLNVIPDSIINKEPTAELGYNQKDLDNLPPYDILDQILCLYIDKRKSYNEIINSGFSPDVTSKILSLIKKSEFKRYQSSLGPKLSDMSFGKDRRYPIINHYDK